MGRSSNPRATRNSMDRRGKPRNQLILQPKHRTSHQTCRGGRTAANQTPIESGRLLGAVSPCQSPVLAIGSPPRRLCPNATAARRSPDRGSHGRMSCAFRPSVNFDIHAVTPSSGRGPIRRSVCRRILVVAWSSTTQNGPSASNAPRRWPVHKPIKQKRPCSLHPPL